VTPVRLVVIGVLLYILYRLLVGPRKEKVSGKKSGPASAGGAVQDVLVEDPVCHTFIHKGQAVELHHDKKMYYFCSEKCCENFLKQKGAEE
jgi:YHS domain-containing protein